MTKTIESILIEKKELEASIKSTASDLRDVLCQTDALVRFGTKTSLHDRLVRRDELMEAYEGWVTACSKYELFMNQELESKD